MSIVWSHSNDVEESLRRSVGQYMRHLSYNQIKVGITSNPDRKLRNMEYSCGGNGKFSPDNYDYT